MTTQTTEFPALDNSKSFMVFDGTPSAPNYVFEGDCKQFSDCFSRNATWPDILDWATEEGYIVIIEGTPQYDIMTRELNGWFGEEDQDEEVFYDKNGNESLGGMYDAGGHIDSDRFADQIDHYRNIIKDRNL